MKIYNSAGQLILEINVTDDSYRYKAIMGENSLTVKFLMPTFKEIPLGSYVDFMGERYTLLRPQNFVKNNSRDFVYTLIFESAQYLLARFKFIELFYTGGVYSGSRKLKFSYTAKPQEHLQMLVNNLNLRDSGWTVGEYTEDIEKVLSFNHTGCDQVLSMIAEAYNTEYEIIGKQINLKKLEYNNSHESALPLSYGYGNGFKTGIKRENLNNSKRIEKLWIQGGSKNINKSEYGSEELHMPISTGIEYNSRNYQTDEEGMSLINSERGLSSKTEDSLDCSHIYPRREGYVSSVEFTPEGEEDFDKQFCDFFDIDNDVDYSQYRIAGEKATVVFQSGMLAGKEFDIVQTDTAITGYIHAEKRFKLVPQLIDGINMPNTTFAPAEGDKYAVFGISMPAEYIASAEIEMLQTACKYLNENEDSKFSFVGVLDGNWVKTDPENILGKILLGGYISFSDTQFQNEPVLIRIIGIKDYINNPYKPEIELSNITGGVRTISSVINTVSSNEVVASDSVRNAVNFTKRGFKDVKETAKLLADSLLQFSGAINPITVQTMQLLVGDESLQFRFIEDALVTPPAIIEPEFKYNKTTKEFTIKNLNVGKDMYLQHMTKGITDIKPDRETTDYLTAILLNDFTTGGYLSGKEDIPYYIYAKVYFTSEEFKFIISETAKSVDEDIDDEIYYFLCGVLNSENDGDRSIALMYGFTEILPSRITTDKITSANAQTYFDLLNGIIAGNIQFRNSQNQLVGVESGLQAYLERALQYGAGKNMFPQSEFQNGIDDLIYAHTIDYLAATGRGVNLSSDWSLNGNTDRSNNQGLNTIWMSHGNWVDEPENYACFYSNFIEGVTGGKKYIASVYAANHRADKVDILVEFFNSAGAFLNSIGNASSCIVLPSENVSGGKQLTGYKRLYIAGTAHQDAVKARIVFRKFQTMADASPQNSYAFFCRPQFEMVDTLTVEAGAWTAYGSSASDYLRSVLKNGTTEIAGGLIAANVLFMKTLAGVITGGLSGLNTDNIGAWFGGTYQNALDDLAKIILRKDGSGQVSGGNIKWDEDGYCEFAGGKMKLTSDNKIVIEMANLTIDENGNIDIKGKISSAETGERIIIDPSTKTLSMYDSSDRLVVKINRDSVSGGTISRGLIQIYSYENSNTSPITTISIGNGVVSITDNLFGYTTSIGRGDITIRNSSNEDIFTIDASPGFSYVGIKTDKLATSRTDVSVGYWYRDGEFIKVRAT